jgi:hypothetical protein
MDQTAITSKPEIYLEVLCVICACVFTQVHNHIYVYNWSLDYSGIWEVRKNIYN